MRLNRPRFAGSATLWGIGRMAKPTRYSPEVRERTVRLVLEQCGNHGSEWETIVSNAAKVALWADWCPRWTRSTACRHGRPDSVRLLSASRKLWNEAFTARGGPNLGVQCYSDAPSRAAGLPEGSTGIGVFPN